MTEYSPPIEWWERDIPVEELEQRRQRAAAEQAQRANPEAWYQQFAAQVDDVQRARIAAEDQLAVLEEREARRNARRDPSGLAEKYTALQGRRKAV